MSDLKDSDFGNEFYEDVAKESKADSEGISKNPDFQTSLNLGSNSEKLLESLLGGVETKVTITTSSGKEIHLRLLTTMEFNLISSFTDRYLESINKHYNITTQRSEEIWGIVSGQIMLMMASTPSTTSGIQDMGLYKYNMQAKLKLALLNKLPMGSYEKLIKTYNAFSKEYDPEYGKLNPEMLKEIIEEVIKKNIQLRELSYIQLIQVAEDLLKDKRLMDKVSQKSV